ncbi:Aste57867_9290 [Aphanomyces stellatus]|uniref:Aste57867_9290 protein n=1 Tax=Aphanomyces stellatus TaxID=120398 RepID=A0A485KMU0_9STRA|nr:hypothetical protein As57867_009254 [Aphanomyces stellatus]VFT86172.1 Aste57867_9290 [Aphanomyces stellatus]
MPPPRDDEPSSPLTPIAPSRLPRSPLKRLLVVGATFLVVYLCLADSVLVADSGLGTDGNVAPRHHAGAAAAHFVADVDVVVVDLPPPPPPQRPDDTVAIVAYVPNTKPEYIGQANRMLWASWNYARRQVNASTRNRTDLIFFVHTSVLDQLPPSCTRVALNETTMLEHTTVDRCYVIEHTPPTDDFWHRNKFFHSLTFLAEPAYRPLLTSYARLLRTDVDCAITPAFLTYRPYHFVVGKGGYMYNQTKPQLLQVVAELNMTHQGLHNLGSTWFGDATLVLDMVSHVLEVAKYILTSPVHGVEKGWPLWHVPVTSMYAGEITLNHYIPKANLLINNRTFDVNAIGDDAIPSVYHIHCWPDDYRGKYFDKWAFKRGEYTRDKYPRASLNTTAVRDFMLLLVLYESDGAVQLPPPQSFGGSAAVIAYVGHTKYVAQAHHLLFASWNYARRQTDATSRNRTDLVLFVHANVMLDDLPPSCERLDPTHFSFAPSDVQHRLDDQCYVVMHYTAVDDVFLQHSFMHSVAYLTEVAYRPFLASYDRLLRTDVDCAITPAFFMYRPTKDRLVVGGGRYMFDQTKAELLRVASELSMTHHGRFNIGSTWYGEATLILDLMPFVVDVAKYILGNSEHKTEKGWPRWHIPVTPMYAGEIVVNHLLPAENLLVSDTTFDVHAISTDATVASIYHIHCWPILAQGQWFDKHAFLSGAYTKDKYPRASLDTTVVRDYVMALALYGE